MTPRKANDDSHFFFVPPKVRGHKNTNVCEWTQEIHANDKNQFVVASYFVPERVAHILVNIGPVSMTAICSRTISNSVPSQGEAPIAETSPLCPAVIGAVIPDIRRQS
jgi:hypothetical protein